MYLWVFNDKNSLVEWDILVMTFNVLFCPIHTHAHTHIGTHRLRYTHVHTHIGTHTANWMNIDTNCIYEFVHFSLRFRQPLLIYFGTLDSWKQLRSLFPLDRTILLLLHNHPLCLQEAIFFVLRSILLLSHTCLSSTSLRLPCSLNWNECLASWAECSHSCVSTVPIMACGIFYLCLT